MKTKKAPKESPALHLLRHVWESCCKANSHSWERVNHAMANALSLAIGAGLMFAEGDVEGLSEFSCGYWIGAENGEEFYTQAVIDGNTSFCEAFENARGRGPFRAWGVEARANSPYLHCNHVHRERERLAVGLTFNYAGERPTVTSFKNTERVSTADGTVLEPQLDGAYKVKAGKVKAGNDAPSVEDITRVVACTYKKVDEYREKVDRRFSLCQGDIVKDHKDMEWKWKVAKDPAVIARAREVMKLAAKTQKEFLKLSRAEIEAALKKLEIVLTKEAKP